LGLPEIAAVLWRGKWLIMVIVAVVVAATILSLRQSTPTYTARMVVAPVKASSSSGVGSTISRTASALGLTSALGGEDSVSPFGLYIETIRSVGLAKTLQEEHKLLQELFPGIWNEERGEWIPPSSFRFRVTSKVKRWLRFPDWTPPSPSTLASFIRGNVRINSLEEQGLRDVTFEHSDREFALRLLQMLHDGSDTKLKEAERKRAEERLSYLRDQLTDVRVTDYRSVLVALLAREQQKMMLIQGNLPFAAEIVDPPSVSAAPTSPRPLLSLVIAVIAGTAIAVFTVLTIDVIRRVSRMTSVPRSDP
jgi:hypothetical protein